jgi:hypothetical protein
MRRADQNILGGQSRNQLTHSITQHRGEPKHIDSNDGDSRRSVTEHHGPSREFTALFCRRLWFTYSAGDGQQWIRGDDSHRGSGPKVVAFGSGCKQDDYDRGGKNTNQISTHCVTFGLCSGTARGRRICWDFKTLTGGRAPCRFNCDQPIDLLSILLKDTHRGIASRDSAHRATTKCRRACSINLWTMGFDTPFSDLLRIIRKKPGQSIMENVTKIQIHVAFKILRRLNFDAEVSILVPSQTVFERFRTNAIQTSQIQLLHLLAPRIVIRSKQAIGHVEAKQGQCVISLPT